MNKDSELNLYPNNDSLVSPEKLEIQFEQDTKIVAEQSAEFIKDIHPAYLYSTKEEIMELTYDYSDGLLDAFTFFRVISCTTDEVAKILHSFICGWKACCVWNSFL